MICMLDAQTNEAVRQQLHLLFPHEVESDLNGLRAPAGSFAVSDVAPLIDKGMVEFDTRTGISCQGIDDWALQLTPTGMETLRASARSDGGAS